MDTYKKVLIVIPTFNGAKYIEQTINSCLNQTYPNIEIIVIDDFSEDNTIDILHKFGNSIKVVESKKHMGLTKNLNKIILKSNSDYFISLGHDDLLDKDHVSVMLNLFDHDTVAVYCNPNLIDRNGKFIKTAYDDNLQKEKSKKPLYYLSLNCFISIVGMMHKTSIFQRIKGCEEKYDLYWEWLYYIKILKFGKIKYTTKIKSFWRIHDSNVSSTLFSLERNISFFFYKLRCRFRAFRDLNNVTHFPTFVLYLLNDLRNHLIKYFKSIFFPTNKNALRTIKNR